MGRLFTELGIRATDFIQIEAGFVITMLVFFRLKDKKYRWLNYLLLLTYALQCVFFILFGEGLNVKLLAGLELISVLVVVTIVHQRRKLGAGQGSAVR